jgi:hypothetical protein
MRIAFYGKLPRVTRKGQSDLKRLSPEEKQAIERWVAELRKPKTPEAKR